MLQLKLTVEPWVGDRFSPFLRRLTHLHEEDVNRKDYRAWYGLGQAYELLSMHHYALHYYQRATALRSVIGALTH